MSGLYINTAHKKLKSSRPNGIPPDRHAKIETKETKTARCE